MQTEIKENRGGITAQKKSSKIKFNPFWVCVAVVLLGVLVGGCVDGGRDRDLGMKTNYAVGQNLSVSGTAESLNLSSASSDLQYKISIRISNDGDSPVTWDTLNGIFIGGQREVNTSVRRYETGTTVIQPGQSIPYEFYSGPETARLISDSVRGKIGFSVILIQDLGEDKQDVILARSALLPVIIADKGQTVTLLPQEEVPLKFTSDNVAVTEELSSSE